MRTKFLTLLFLFAISLHAQDKKAYQLFDKNGKKISYDKLLKASLKIQVLLFGEYHNNSVAHWLQLELTKDVAAQTKQFTNKSSSRYRKD